MFRFGPLLAMLMVLSIACATATRPRGTSDEDWVVAAEREWADAVKTRDRARAEQILADEFVLTGPATQRLSTRRVTTKGVWLDTLARLEVRHFDLIEPRVLMHGDTAVVNLRASIDWSLGERKLPSDYLLTDVWIKRDGRWQVVLRSSQPR